jgi:hypothetical protein
MSLHFQRITWRYIPEDRILKISRIVRQIIRDFEIRIPSGYRPSLLHDYIDEVYCHYFRVTIDGGRNCNRIY